MAVEGRTQRPVIVNEVCNTCAVCIKGCPAETIPELRAEEASLRGRVYEEVTTAPSVNIDKIFDMPPCQSACPVHQDIRDYIRLIAAGQYEAALKSIRETNALPSVTGYVCSHPCEEVCVRSLVDEPVSIKALKRFVADGDNSQLKPPKIGRGKGKKVSIIGAGPAGLAAAYDLSKIGYGVTIIEAFPEPGGMLRWAIPSFRLPRHVLNRDITYIEKMGVVIKAGIKFGVDITLADLKKQGADAVILAIGTHHGLDMGIANKTHGGRYMDCLAFLRKYASGEQIDLGERVIVVGGGNAAVDAARSARRCGAKEVKIFYRRSYEEMPADRDELEEAQAEGIEIEYLSAPVKIIGNNGDIEGLEFVKTRLGEPDKSGRRKPIPIKGSEFVVNADLVISAIGQQPDLSWNHEGLPFNFSPENTFITDGSSMTGVAGVFAAGDAVSGPTTIVAAMASGKKVAGFVDSYLSGKE